MMERRSLPAWCIFWCVSTALVRARADPAAHFAALLNLFYTRRLRA